MLMMDSIFIFEMKFEFFTGNFRQNRIYSDFLTIQWELLPNRNFLFINIIKLHKTHLSKVVYLHQILPSNDHP